MTNEAQKANVNGSLDQQDLLDIVLLSARFTGALHIGYRTENVYCSNSEGHVFEFLPPELVNQALPIALKHFRLGLAQSKTHQEIAAACALFWMQFISIHPFRDGNGRAGVTFISEQLNKIGWSLRDLTFRRFNIGMQSPEEDLQTLSRLFIISIGPQFPKSQTLKNVLLEEIVS